MTLGGNCPKSISVCHNSQQRVNECKVHGAGSQRSRATAGNTVASTEGVEHENSEFEGAVIIWLSILLKSYL